MRKLIYLLGFITITAHAQYVPVQYNTNTGVFAYGGTNGVTTNTYFSTLNVGNLTINTNGIAVTNNYGWEDLRFPVGVAAPVTPNADIVLDTAENALTFKAGAGGSTTNFADDHVYGVAQFPHTWRMGSDISAHVHFIQKFSDETNSWYMRWRWLPLGEATNSEWNFTGPAINMFAFNTTNIHQMAVFTNIYLSGEESSILDWKIYSLGSAVSNDLTFKEFDIHYQIEKPTGERLGI